MPRRGASLGILAATLVALASPAAADGVTMHIATADDDPAARAFALALATMWSETVTGLTVEAVFPGAAAAAAGALRSGAATIALLDPRYEAGDTVALFLAYGAEAAADGAAAAVMVSPDMPEDHAYTLTRAAFERHDRLRQATAGGAVAGIADTALLLSIPLHPGAARYLAERGFPPPE